MTIPKFKRLSPAQQRDLAAYLSNLPQRGTAEPWNLVDHEATTIEEWYWLWDTHGIRARFCDQALTWRLVQAKGQLNLTIKLWIEDIIDERFALLRPDEVWEYCHTMPRWVWMAFIGQLRKACPVFRFQQVRLAPDDYTFWPVSMDNFDPNI